MPKRSLLLFSGALFLLSLLTSLYFRVQPSAEFHQDLMESYIHRQEEDAARLLADSSLMRKLVQQSQSLEELKALTEKPYGFFLYAETLSEFHEPLFWNNQRILPPPADFNLPDTQYAHQLANGFYIISKRTIHLPGMTNHVIAYTMIPVQYRDMVTAGTPRKEFAHDREAIGKIELSERPTDYPVKSLEGSTLFHIRRLAHSSVNQADVLTVIIRLIALLFLLFYFHIAAEMITRKYRLLYGVAFLVLALVFTRGIMYLFPQLLALDQFNLFRPLVYASNNFNRSLGDLLINSMLICWIILFVWYHSGPVKRMPSFLQKDNRRYIAGGAAVFILILSTFQTANIVRGLVADSKISFNVTDFFSLNLYTFIGFLVLALLSVAFYYFTRLLLSIIFVIFRENQVYIYFLIALTGLVFLTFRIGNEIVTFHIPVLIWLVVYTLLVSQEQFIINRFRATVAGILFWIFVFSISLSAIILNANRENEIQMRQTMAEKYHEITDPSAESTLNIAVRYLDNRFLLGNFHRFRDGVQNRILRDSIATDKVINSGYARRYDTRIYVFDSLNNPVNNDDPTSYAELNAVYTLQSKLISGQSDLYYHETSFERFAFMTRRLIRSDTAFVGTFFLISTPRHFGNTEALSGNLFRQANLNDPANSPNYSYAVYRDNVLTMASAKYPFPISLSHDQIPRTEYLRKESGDFDELWYRPTVNKVIVVAKKSDSLLESITLFSYLFCAFLLMVGVLELVSFIFRVINEKRPQNIFTQLNIRTQIHGTVIFISVLSFLVIGVATISFFIARYNRNNVDRLSRTAGVMVREMQKRLSEFDLPPGRAGDSAANINLRNLVNEVADIHNTDVNVYDLQGNLEVSSESEVYRQGALSTKMHPLAYYHLNNLRQVQRVQRETISNLDYLSIYTVVRDNQGQPRKYLNIPYFASQLDLNQEISNFLVTIINLNAFIFLIAGIIAFFITSKITQSFSVIGEKMREITLGRTNEPIVWTRRDEIGELVKQYNKMVHELEKSAEALAKSEREGAWREMARQVAHEIKNPLTPMKLSIQYLQKAITDNKGNVKELTESVASTLIEQIDHLSKIAADFSQFANISVKKTERVDLHQVLGSLVELYGTNPRVHIEWNALQGRLPVAADKTHMNRLFTNLLANAVDAAASRPECRITIREEILDGSCIIRIADNGEGIPEETRARIFTPNFTTKTSGTGLGLAMCKSIVEQTQGDIWFETETGEGTTFFVRLPLLGS